jgi:hypothetical protein
MPAILVAVGGGTVLAGIGNKLEDYSGVFMVIGIGLLAIGLYQHYKDQHQSRKVSLLSNLTCPECGFKKEETMPTNACQYFYKCDNCMSILKPLQGDCCVYCSYGTVSCPPIQLDQNCC